MVVFVHIPKAGGSTLYWVLRGAYPVSALYKLQMSDASVAEYQRLDPRRRAGIQVVYGHMDMSLRGMLPSDARYVTMLRHPVQRILSFYYYVRYMTTDALHDLAVRMPVSGWVRNSNFAELDNGMVRRLCGMPAVPIGGCTRAMLEQAKANLDQFFFVGLTERYDETYVALSRLLGWDVRYYRPEKKNTQRSSTPKDDRETIAEIEKFNELDMELYRHGVQLFERRVASMDLAPGLDELRFRRESRYARFTDDLRHLADRIRLRIQKKWLGYRRFG